MEDLSNTPDNPNESGTAAESRRKRRRFSRKQKLAILAEVDRCIDVADLAALLQREGVYSSHLTVWRKQLSKQVRDRSIRKSVPPPALAPRDPVIDRLEHENAKLQRELRAANNVIELQRSSLRMPPVEYTARADAGK